MNTDLHARSCAIESSGTASSVRDAAKRDGALAQMEARVRDVDTVALAFDVGVVYHFRLDGAVVFDLDFELKWRHTMKRDGNDLLAI